MLALRSPVVARGVVTSSRPVFSRPTGPQLKHARPVPTRATGSGGSGGSDFDDLLITMANKFEKAENKPAIVGWSVAAVFALFTAEWLIHLPLLDFLLGFPVQLLGLFMLPYLGLRYLVDGGDVNKDVEEYASTIIKKLPGLEK